MYFDFPAPLLLVLVLGRVLILGLVFVLYLGKAIGQLLLCLGDHNLADALANAEHDITVALGTKMRDAPGRNWCLCFENGLEGATVTDDEADGMGEMWGDSYSRVSRLLDILLVKLGDQGGLDRRTTGGEFRWIDRCGAGCRGKDWSRCWEKRGKTMGDSGSM